MPNMNASCVHCAVLCVTVQNASDSTVTPLLDDVSLRIARLALPSRREELTHVEPGERVTFRVEDNLV